MVVNLDQADIYAEIKGSGKPLLMIHGNWCDHRLMKGCMESIFTDIPGWKRIYFDLPGMGDTFLKKEISSTDDIFNIVDEFISKVITEDIFYIASESYGSYIARALVKKYQARTGGIMMLCPVVVPFQEERDLPRKEIVFRDNVFYETLSGNDQDTCDMMLTLQISENWERYLSEVRCGVRKANISLLKKIKKYGYSFREDIDRLDIPFNKPALILTGKQDISVGYKDALALIDNYPHGDFVILDSAGHMLQIEQRAIFEKLVINWLRKLH